MPKVYLSIGTNIGDRFSNLQTAINQLIERDTVLGVSKVYETEPVGEVVQDDFYNIVAVLAVAETVTPSDLLLQTQAIEKAMKRVKAVHWGPRTIDLDILLFDDMRIMTDVLTIPHPEIANRLFVLQPLLEVAQEINDTQVIHLATQLLADTHDQNWVRPTQSTICYR